MKRAAGVFGSVSAGPAPGGGGVYLKALHAKLGELTLKNEIFLSAALGKAGLLNAKR